MATLQEINAKRKEMGTGASNLDAKRALSLSTPVAPAPVTPVAPVAPVAPTPVAPTVT